MATEAPVALLCTLLDRTLSLLAGLESEASWLGTLRMVEDLAMTGFDGVLVGLFMLLMEPVVAGARVLTAGSSSAGATLEAVQSTSRKLATVSCSCVFADPA